MALLGDTMAEILSVLALSTKSMKEGRISELIYVLYFSMADNGSEKVLKRLMGKLDVEDALLRLDELSKEEKLAAVAKSLELAHNIDENVKSVKGLAEDINDKVRGIETVTHNIDRIVQETKESTQRPLSVLLRGCADTTSHRVPKQERIGFSYSWKARRAQNLQLKATAKPKKSKHSPKT